MKTAEDPPDRDCFTMPDGSCVAPICKLHGPLQLATMKKLDTIPDKSKRAALEAFHQRVLVARDSEGRPRHLTAQSIQQIAPETLPSSLPIDPDFTGGLDVAEYLRRNWSGP